MAFVACVTKQASMQVGFMYIVITVQHSHLHFSIQNFKKDRQNTDKYEW